MFFQKVFHVHQPLLETRRQLARLGVFRGRLPGLKKAVITDDGVAQFECSIDQRLDVHAVLVELPTEEENHILFHSTVGNVRVSGFVALTSIRPGVTEVQLVLDYSLRSMLNRLVDFCTRRVERYVEATLCALQQCLNAEAANARIRAAQTFSSRVPQFAH